MQEEALASLVHSPAPMRDEIATALGVIALTATALPLLPARVWWIRVWDFPRVQIAAVGAFALLLGFGDLWTPWPQAVFAATLAVGIAAQLALVWRYTPLAPREVDDAEHEDPERRLSLLVANVLQDNDQYAVMLRTLQDADADVILCVETDDVWMERLAVLAASHPHAIRRPQSNTYGMLLYSRLKLEDSRLEFLLRPDIPSIHTTVVLRDGRRVSLHCLHPRPPVPTESEESLERDAELLLVGQRVREAAHPVVVLGDLNDVAWSRTTRLFQKVSGLIDPRKGRGLFGTFHAGWPGFRFPLDHVFHSADFRLVRLERLGHVGSDHFPVCVTLSLEPGAERAQEAPRADAGNLEEASDAVAEGQRRA